MSLNLNDIKKKIKPLASGGSLNDVYRLLYHISLLKYATVDHLKKSHKTAYKVATVPKLKKLTEFDFISEKHNIFTANNQTLEILKMVKINGAKVDVSLLPQPPSGYGSINELNNTDVFVDAINLEHYCALIYPHFSYIRPDGLLVLKKERMYKLVFLEIEAEKSNWDEWLNRKRYNYLKLSKDIAVYDYWQATAPKLKLPVPVISDFRFTVTIVGNVKKDWGECFHFCNNLRE